MKVGTDAVLLGAWVDLTGALSILDVGTGCGVIALMLAQRTQQSQIHALEPDPASVEEAGGNFLNSRWADRLTLHRGLIQAFDADAEFDLLVSNPPYFVDSLLPPSGTRQAARHEGSMTHEQLLTKAKTLLRPSGRLAVVLPTVEGDRFRRLAGTVGFRCRRSLAFFSKAEKPQERWLMEFGFDAVDERQEKLVLYDRDGVKSDSYTKLVDNFLL